MKESGFQSKQITRVVVAELAYFLLNFFICKLKVKVNTLLETARCSINRSKVQFVTSKLNIRHSKTRNLTEHKF